MKIKRFTATKVYGHYDFDLSFNDDITFLVGINGSGKTTALRLMQAAMSFDLITLFSIKFSRLSILFEASGARSLLTILNSGQELAFSMGEDNFDIKIPIMSDEEASIYRKSDRLDGYVAEKRMMLMRSSERAASQLSRMERPLFLGLERRAERYSDEPYYYDEDVVRHMYRPRRGSLEGIDNCQRLIERAYRRFRKISDGTSARLVNFVVDSMFEYYPFDPNSWESITGASEFQGLVARRREIESLAANLGGGRDFSNKINGFFSKIGDALDAASNANKNDSISIEWLLNRSQAQRIQHLLAEMDRQKKAVERQYRPIAEFIESLNGFFCDSRKVASIDSLGRLKVHQHGSEISLASMSSGEKQLLILLGHARFARGDGGVVIVDEPEVSLHLRWQERLIEEVAPEGESMQFIFATHSPEIVGYRKSKCISVN